MPVFSVVIYQGPLKQIIMVQIVQFWYCIGDFAPHHQGHGLARITDMILYYFRARSQFIGRLFLYLAPWWRHQMEAFSALLAICAGNSPVPGEFPTQRPVTRRFYVFFDLRLNKRLSKQSWGWWFETLSHPLWRHRKDSSHLATGNVALGECEHGVGYDVYMIPEIYPFGRFCSGTSIILDAFFPHFASTRKYVTCEKLWT